jgi:threonine dehydratase
MTKLDNINKIYFKREDQNITGSAKDRVIPSIINFIDQQHIKEAVISSTGNAAISAQYFCDQKNIKLTVFVSPRIDKQKLKLIKNPIISAKPISDAFKYAKQHKSYFIRLSTDKLSSHYQSIASELLQQIPQMTDLFIPCGSGATALNIAKHLPNHIKVFIVQPASHCPLASIYDHDYIPEQQTITTALSAKYLPLKPEIKKIIKHGIVVQNNQVIKAQDFLQNNNIITSPEGALALAGYFKKQLKHGQYPVILLTGTTR